MNKNIVFLVSSVLAGANCGAFQDLPDYSKDIVSCLVYASKDIERSKLTSWTADLFKEVERIAQKPVSGLNYATIEKAVSQMEHNFVEAIYQSLTKEEKEMAIEGLFLQFLDLNRNKSSLKVFIERLMYTILKGKSVNDKLEPILLANQKEINEIRFMGKVPKIMLLKWKSKFQKLSDLMEPMVTDVLSKKSSKYIGSTAKFRSTKDLSTAIEKAVIERVALN